MRKMNFLFMTLAVGALFFLGGCDVTIYPESELKETDYQLDVETETTLMTSYKNVDENGNEIEGGEEGQTVPVFTPSDRYLRRYIIEIRQRAESSLTGRLIDRHEQTLKPEEESLNLNLRLPGEGDYTAIVWYDYVPTDTGVEPVLFQADDLTAITMNPDVNPAEVHCKDAFAGYTHFSMNNRGEITMEGGYAPTRAAEGEKQPLNISLYRASARYRVFATDLDKFNKLGRSADQLTVKVVYQQYVACGFNALRQQPNQWVASRTIETKPQMQEDGKLCLACDYLFVESGHESHVLADLYIYDAAGDEVSHVSGVDIPLQRDAETVIQGNFLTRKAGISTDEEFDDEDIIQL